MKKTLIIGSVLFTVVGIVFIVSWIIIKPKSKSPETSLQALSSPSVSNPAAFVDTFRKQAINDTNVLDQRTSGENSARKTGIFSITGVEKQLDWCMETDGYINETVEDSVPTGEKFMSTHIHQVNSDNTIDVYVDSSGETKQYAVDNIFIKDHPNSTNISATLSDLEAGDCVLLIGVEASSPVDIYGLR